jgi:hypothetical protein
MVRRPRSTTVSTGGRRAASDSSCSTRWWTRARSPGAPPSTAPTSRLSAPHSAETGGSGAGDRALARRPDHQGPRAHRCHRPSVCADTDAGQRRRRESCARAARPHGTRPLSPAAPTASAPSATTVSATKAATWSRTPSAASRTSDVSPPATTSSPPTSCQASPSRSGRE